MESSPIFATAEHKKRLLARLARAEGQIRGIQRMIEREEDCEKIAQQLSAARAALSKAFYEMIACALETKLTPFVDDVEHGKRRISELAALLSKYA